MEQYTDHNKIEPTNIFPKPPILDLLTEPIDSITNNSKGNYMKITNVSIL